MARKLTEMAHEIKKSLDDIVKSLAKKLLIR